LESGAYYAECAVYKEKLPENWEKDAETLWKKSEEMVKEFQE
jgi:hypothetical protein